MHPILALKDDEFVAAEMDVLYGRPAGGGECEANSLLSEDIDLAGSKLRLICSDRKQRLDWVVGECRNLRVDAVTSILIQSVMNKE